MQLCWGLSLRTAEKELRSLGFFVISTPSEYVSRYILPEGTWSSAAWIQSLYTVLLFPSLVGWAPYSWGGKLSLSSFYSNGQYTDEIVSNEWMEYKSCGCTCTSCNCQCKSLWRISCIRAYGRNLAMVVAKSLTKSSPMCSCSLCLQQWAADGWSWGFLTKELDLGLTLPVHWVS